MTETVVPTAPTITELFARAVERWSERVAFRLKRQGEWAPVTFGEYGALVRACAGGLAAAGLQPGEFGAILASNRPEWHEADFGLINAGLVSCPVYPTNAPGQVAYLLQHSASAVVFAEDETQRAKIEQIRADCPAVRLCVVFSGEGTDGGFFVAWEDFLERGRTHLAEHPQEYDRRRAAARPEDLLAVIYTSGTTGAPKGTMLSHHNAVFTLASLDQVMEAGPQDRKLSFLPLSHVAERASSEYLQLQQGFEVWFAESALTLGEDLKAARPTLQFVVPRVLEKQYDAVRALLDALPDEQREAAAKAVELGRQRTRAQQQGGALPEDLEAAWQQADRQLFSRLRAGLGYDAIRILVSGAAPIALELLEFFNAIGVRLYEVYGQTEDHGPTTINRLERFKLGTVGYAIPGGEVRIAEDGEILYRGDNVCMGYYKDPEATAELLDADGWLHTGDVGVLDDDGFLTITDRKKDLLITAAGKNIAPQMLEQKLKFSPWVSQAIVIGDRRRYVTALLTLDEAAVTRFAEQKSLPHSSLRELSRHPDVVGLVEAHVAHVNRDLSPAEQVKKFRILPEDFSVAAGTVTPTLKIKRTPILDRYADLVEEMYTEPATA
jgi:long-chain acyl-CoA synthetase